MKRNQAPGLAFFVIGIVFIAVGSSGPHALLAVGVVFAVLGLAVTMRARRSQGPR